MSQVILQNKIMKDEATLSSLISRNITSITIPDGVTSIGGYAFYNCSALTSVTIQNGTTSIGEQAFANCYALNNLKISNSVTSIGNYAFYSCSALTNVTIPNSVTSIGEAAFSTCRNLLSLTVKSTSPPTLGDYAFQTTPSAVIYVPAESVDTYKAASGWSTYSSKIQAIPA